MTDTFFATLNQVLMLLLFMLAGFFLKKKHITPAQTPGVLSKLVVWLFMPALCFKTFAQNFNLQSLAEKSSYVLAGAVVWTVTFAIAIFLARLFVGRQKDCFDKQIYVYSLTFPNFGYIGYPLVEAVFGELFLFDMMMFSIVYNLTVYTLGFYLLDPDRGKFSLKSVVNPPIVGIAAGMAVGLLGIPLPSFVRETVFAASGCMAPVAMLLTGYVLAGAPLKATFTQPKVYLICLLRLIGIPALIGAAFYFLGAQRELIIIAVTLLAVPTGLNSVVVPQSKGLDTVLGAQCAFISNLIGIFTIPVVFGLLSALS